MRPGDEVTVKVLRVDDDNQKISLGLKQLQADPWSKVEATYAVGPGVRRPRHAARGVRRVRRASAGDRGVGPPLDVSSDRVPGRLEGVGARGHDGLVRDPEHRAREEADRRRARRGRSRTRRRSRAGNDIVPGARLTGKVERHEKFGVFVFLAPGRTGLIPMKETGVAREADIARTFPIGGDVEVLVLEVDPSGRRIRLSRKAVLEAKEKDEVREYSERSRETPAESFGSLADKLRGAITRRSPSPAPASAAARRTRRRRSAPTARSRACPW